MSRENPGLVEDPDATVYSTWEEANAEEVCPDDAKEKENWPPSVGHCQRCGDQLDYRPDDLDIRSWHDDQSCDYCYHMTHKGD